MMNLFTFEQTRSVYWADFFFYGAMIVVLGGVLAVAVPNPQWVTVMFLAAMGLVAWSALEYAVHRFVLHGMQPFRRWHAAHHARPSALISSPTTLTASIIGAGLFLPVWAIAGLECACASTIGLLCGYLAYALTHHAIHHWHAQFRWLRRRKRWHVLHHHESQPCCYGVTSGFWDEVCGTRRGRPGLAASPENHSSSLPAPPQATRPTLHLQCRPPNLLQRVCSRYRTPRPTTRISSRPSAHTQRPKACNNAPISIVAKFENVSDAA